MIDLVNIPYGNAYPLGATCYKRGVNFSLFSKNAEHIELWFFDQPSDSQPSRIFKLNYKKHRTFYYWHIFVEGVKPGQLYGYKVFGPNDPKQGYRFDGDKLLLDPYARAVSNFENYDRNLAKSDGENSTNALKSVVVDPYDYDWETDVPINRPYSTSVIYEMHVRGITANPNSGIEEHLRGSYKGLIEKIPYLKELGINAVELMPIQQFDPQDAMPGKSNYWGYSPIAFFAPHIGFSSESDPVAACNEFRDMVKAFHKAGIEVILDVVFNHTAEGDEDGPMLSFRGIENKAYYILEEDQTHYKNYTGCGNTLNANHSIVRRMIGDCLRSWVTEYHIDGFRFDLASVLSRDESGQPLKNPPLLWEIESDPVLAGTKIIAEAWDAAGLYQVGSFIGDKWTEWNGKYRDDIRRFIKGDQNTVTKFASRIIGSPDIYETKSGIANRNIHFVTCHDGFTMNDLVSYNVKYNLDNGENNNDGTNENYSWNCGIEGQSTDSKVESTRVKQIKNFLALTFISQGTPMILMGDEVRRSQNGNNNAYCQDNEISWFDWSLVDKNSELLEFTKSIISYTQKKELFRIEEPLITRFDQHQPFVTWHGVKLNKPDWNKNSHSLAFTLSHPDSGELLHVMVNAYWRPLLFELPKIQHANWNIMFDTSQNPGFYNGGFQISNNDLEVKDRSIIILEAID